MEQPLRVAFFVHRFPVVSEAFIVNAAIGLLDVGCELDIYALHGAGLPEEAQHASIAAHGHRWRCLPFRLRETPRRRIALAPWAFARLAARHGSRARAAFHRELFGEAGPNLTALHEASLFLHGGKYDVLHCQFGTLAETVLNHRKAGFLSGALVAHFRGHDISGHLSEHGLGAHDRVLGESDGVFTNCQFFAERLAGLGAPAGRIRVIPSSVEIEQFPFQERSHKPGDTVRLLCVGRLVEKKGFSDAISALSLLRKQGLDAVCTIIGEGPLRSDLEAQVQTLGLNSHVHFQGAGSHQQIAQALKHAHIFLAPSTTAANGDQDASINTLKEAMATGCPFVATRHGGIPELTEGIDAGLLVPERAPDRIAEAVRILLERQQDWCDMGLRGRSRIVEGYSISAAASATLQGYRAAIAGECA